MINVSVRLPDGLLQKADSMAQSLHIARAEYIRRAIEHMNEEALKLKRKKRLIQASLKTRKESMKVNAEFSGVEYDPND